MTAEQVKTSIETRELQLTNRQKLIHYKVVILLLFIGIFGLFFSLKEYISGTYNLFIYAGIGFFIFSVVIGILLYKLQRHRLKFYLIDRILANNDLKEIIEKVKMELKWSFFIVDTNIIIAKTKADFLLPGRGELITILFDKNKILINSIYDPSKKSLIFPFSPNRKNVRILVERIKEKQMANIDYSELVKFAE